MKKPKITNRFCPTCKKKSVHKVKLVSTGKKKSSLTRGSIPRAKKRGGVPGMGNKGRYGSKPPIKKLSEAENFAGFFFKPPKSNPDIFNKTHLEKALVALSEIKNWDIETLNNSLIKVVKNNAFKTGDFFMDIRIAIAGSRFTPPINDSMLILGKEEVTKRIKRILE